MSMKNSKYTNGNLTRDLPSCSAVPQPTAPPRASHIYCIYYTSAWNQAFNVMMVIMWTGPSVCCLILLLGSLPRLNCVFVPILKLLTACKLLAVLWRVQTTKPTTFSIVIFGLLFVLTHRNRITDTTSWMLWSGATGLARSHTAFP